MNSKKVTVHNNLANLYIAQKHFGKAIPHLKTVIAKRPNDLRARNLLHIVEVIQQIVTLYFVTYFFCVLRSSYLNFKIFLRF